MGFDLLAASAIDNALKRRFSDVKLIAVVPYRNQSEVQWYEQKRYQYALQNADEVIVLREKYGNGWLCWDAMIYVGSYRVDWLPSMMSKQRAFSTPFLKQVKAVCQ